MKLLSFVLLFTTVVLLTSCSSQQPPTPLLGVHEQVQAENNLFLQQKTFDPWILTSIDPTNKIPAYLGNGLDGRLYDSTGSRIEQFSAGNYNNGVISSSTFPASAPASTGAGGTYQQTLDMRNGSLTTSGISFLDLVDTNNTFWRSFWRTSDIVIDGDPEAQQVTHAELFYLCSSIAAGSAASIPPMGLSSSVYNGHIFWDAEIWMMPALLPQHPDLAKSIVDYRFARLKAAEALAKSHGYAGAEYPWESAATGKEEAPPEFSAERHITADIAYAAWQYYLWTGDSNYLTTEGWPVLKANADYWLSRATRGSDGHYHISNVIGPDETAGLVKDDAWTNAVVQYTLNAAANAAAVVGQPSNPTWGVVARKLLIPYDPAAKVYLQYPAMNQARQMAKQADTQMLIYPMNEPMSNAAASNTLDYYIQHTIAFGPAMTSSIDATIAARLGRAQQSLDLYHESFRPFMRGPWDAFSEKRTKSDVYFTTGMGGSLQTVLYGFAGLNVSFGSRPGEGLLVAKSGDTSLYADPHLPPGWKSMTVKGVKFRGKTYTLTVSTGNKVEVSNGV
jgi:trehalose/maltose hydrolase-like predicted phosphorylase